MTKHPCGCITDIDSRCGAIFSVKKCRSHERMRQEVGELGEKYYQGLGAIVDGIPQCARYIEEFEEAFGTDAIPMLNGSDCIEIGCGCSMYAPMFLAAGANYIGVDPSPYARRWTSSTFRVTTLSGMELFRTHHKARAVLAAHSLEHMKDPLETMSWAYDRLSRRGTFFIIIPDDTDLFNPDHLWFFNTTTLRNALQSIGFAISTMRSFKRIERENFIYCKAVKP